MFSHLQLRDLFAAALSGLLAWSPENTDCQLSAKDAADEAFDFADAMLARREKVLPAPAAKPETPTGNPAE